MTGAAADDERAVFADEAEEFERAGFGGEFGDGGAVELLAGGDEVADDILHEKR